VLSPVPTLAEIAQNPERIDGLPLNVVAGLMTQLSALGLRLASRVATAPPMSVNAGDDEILDVDAAAVQLGVKPRTLQSRARKDPRYRVLLVDNGTRLLRFSAARICAFRAGKAPAKPDGPGPFPDWLATRRGGGQPK
jgi:hypothetical protein